MFNYAHVVKMAGWKLYHVMTPADDLLVSVAPNVDLDDNVTAFCHEEQEMIKIQGWNCTFQEIDYMTGKEL
jgi:hypothetical protein